MNQKIKDFEDKYNKAKKFNFGIGDTVDVHFRISEGDKTRIQIFNGIVIAIRGTGMGKTFTVRRISYGEGVERVFPVNSHLIENIEVVKKGDIRRAKLYYLRGKKGKKASTVKEKVD